MDVQQYWLFVLVWMVGGDGCCVVYFWMCDGDIFQFNGGDLFVIGFDNIFCLIVDYQIIIGVECIDIIGIKLVCCGQGVCVLIIVLFYYLVFFDLQIFLVLIILG